MYTVDHADYTTDIQILAADPAGETDPIQIAQAIDFVTEHGYAVMPDEHGGGGEIDSRTVESQIIVVTVWPETLTAPMARALVCALVNSGRIFGVTFKKRTTGETRRMVCRGHVKKHLAGGEPAYDLAPVYDIDHAAYRCIPLDALVAVRCNGNSFTVAA